jgi:hypothetical protein
MTVNTLFNCFQFSCSNYSLSLPFFPHSSFSLISSHSTASTTQDPCTSTISSEPKIATRVLFLADLPGVTRAVWVKWAPGGTSWQRSLTGLIFGVFRIWFTHRRFSSIHKFVCGYMLGLSKKVDLLCGSQKEFFRQVWLNYRRTPWEISSNWKKN